MELPQLQLEKISKNPMCFGCGLENPHSLKMTFIEENGTARSEFLPKEHHQSWPGYVHGGALMAALDEAIGKVVFEKGIWAVTAKIEIRLKSMARLGEKLIILAEVTKQTSRTVEVRARMTRQDDSIVAEASALMYIVK